MAGLPCYSTESRISAIQYIEHKYLSASVPVRDLAFYYLSYDDLVSNVYHESRSDKSRQLLFFMEIIETDASN